MRSYVLPYRADFDAWHQGPCLLNFQAWAYEDLHVPPIPEPRNFRAIYSALRPYARELRDLRLIIDPVAGPVIFCQGNREVILGRKP